MINVIIKTLLVLNLFLIQSARANPTLCDVNFLRSKPELEKIFTQFQLDEAQKLNLNSQYKIQDFLFLLKNEERITLERYQIALNNRLRDIKNKKSFLYGLQENSKINNQEDIVQELLNFFEIEVRSKNMKTKFKKYNQWVTSESHALFAYNTLLNENSTHTKEVLRYLYSKNPFFKDTKVSNYTGQPVLITYSFEKESGKPVIAKWFKPAKYDDQTWFKLGEEEQIQYLKESTNVKKAQINDSIITNTEDKPYYIGGYSEELGISVSDKSYSWEVANKSYEISLKRLNKQVREVSQFTNETHSFHTHIVFNLPSQYKKMKEFKYWTKHVNDYLSLKGLEEGLHGNYLTSVAHIHGIHVPMSQHNVNNSLPDSVRGILESTHKFFSMGIRGRIYGKTNIDGTRKIGLELRDVTRDLDKLELYMSEISDTIVLKRWEVIDPEQLGPIDDLGMIFTKESDFDKYFESKVSETFMNFMKTKILNASIPLNTFETKAYINYRLNKVMKVTTEQQQRIIEARNIYIEDIIKIDKEMQDMIKDGQRVHDEDIEAAIKMTISEWAKRAKTSELFENY